ncbi:DNA cytosine methyltransferase [Stutzerimonas stutzeri]|uniref:DNA cytosine methyltransferase n=1 Tax=Stutzerimonas stutzeri TaxID=316 RepID=UPI000F79506A|nr:DNA cytosine methyltransferase [Stutzerimonas stutzeri]MCQ4236447.1 DNA cytosine methyltransferase [Stutzerimonas stutzeri]MDH0212768.1 DNA cytosine methyltransferase [Stutzerimonas stutzeri]MDH0260699.1 DNA cytosine methyltransferase [Stutzerimonas stutzeri]MDH0503185.1 DNA cytosine methyltransferase [Stutzerimonas stutzeri]MDH0728095.1 DNA cytosine methyltransferase [Stutzerimonas stutzeri]
MRQPTALVACEFSGRVRDALTRAGFYAVSCDLLPSETEGEHIQGDVLEVLDWGWDLLIAHPPCTDLATSGARWFPEKIADGRQARALDFVRTLLAAPIPFKALENPKSVISGQIRKPDQIIQPWMFGHGERKETHFWLQNLPLLVPTEIVDGREPTVHHMAPGPDRWKNRSRTYQGIADAIATQWGGYVLSQLASPTRPVLVQGRAPGSSDHASPIRRTEARAERTLDPARTETASARECGSAFSSRAPEPSAARVG